jgi:predicted nucleic acid-binding protein
MMSKLRPYISEADAAAVIAWLDDSAIAVPDPDGRPSVRSADAQDDHLIALASTERVALVSGDKHLLKLDREIPVFSPRQFLELLRHR